MHARLMNACGPVAALSNSLIIFFPSSLRQLVACRRRRHRDGRADRQVRRRPAGLQHLAPLPRQRRHDGAGGQIPAQRAAGELEHRPVAGHGEGPRAYPSISFERTN